MAMSMMLMTMVMVVNMLMVMMLVTTMMMLMRMAGVDGVGDDGRVHDVGVNRDAFVGGVVDVGCRVAVGGDDVGDHDNNDAGVANGDVYDVDNGDGVDDDGFAYCVVADHVGDGSGGGGDVVDGNGGGDDGVDSGSGERL